MNTTIRELQHLLELKKNASDKKRMGILNKQVKSLLKLKKTVLLDYKYIQEIVLNIQSLESNKDYVISKSKMLRILKEKEVEKHFETIFSEEMDQLKPLLDTLENNIRMQIKGSQSSVDYNYEYRIYAEILQILQTIENSKLKIVQYFTEVQSLTYNKKYIKTWHIISKIIQKTLFKLEVYGLENIPSKGACIIAPHHYHATIDPVILTSVIKRSIFFATSVEAFVSVPLPLYDKYLYAVGCLPIKRDDALFQNRTEEAIPSEKIRNYASSNISSIKNMLTHFKYGDAVVIFPEGEAKILPTYERSHNEEFLDPDTGFVSLSFMGERKLHKKIPIIPVGVQYSSKNPRSIRITFGKPVVLEDSLQKMPRPMLKKEIQIYTKSIFKSVMDLSS